MTVPPLIRIALRRNLRNWPVSTAIALTVATAIAGAGAMWAFADTLLFSSPLDDASDSLVRIYTSEPDGSPYGSTSWADLRDIRLRSGQLASVAGSQLTVRAIETGSSGPRRAVGVQASTGFFRTLGLRPLRGRWPLEGEGSGVVLSHRLWAREFGRDPELSELRLRIGGRRHPVIAVAPPSFQGLVPGIAPGYWTVVDWPTLASLGAGRRQRSVKVIGRLAEGGSLAGLREELEVIAGELEAAFPEANRGRGFQVLRGDEVRFGPEIDRTVEIFAGVLAGAALLLVLMFGANLFGLVAARVTRDETGLATRMALGASRGQLLTQSWVEALLPVAAGAVVGLAGARWVVQAALARLGEALPFDLTLSFTPRVFVVLAAGAGILTVALGVLSYLAMTASAESLVPGRGRRGSGASPGRLVRLSMTVQASAAVVLVLAAAILGRSIQRDVGPALGFRHDGLAVARISLEGEDPGSAELARVAEVVSSRPDAVAFSSWIPLDPMSTTWTARLGAGDSPQDALSISAAGVDGAYFDLFGIEILSGRGFRASELRTGAEGPLPLVVNERLAEVLREDGLSAVPGALVRFPGLGVGGEVGEVVGVVGDHKVTSASGPPDPLAYYPLGRRLTPDLWLTVDPRRVPGGAAGVTRRLTQVPGISPERIEPIEDHVARAVAVPTLLAGAFGTLGALGGILVVIGVVGATMHLARRRLRELAIRAALGARRLDLLWRTLKTPVSPVLAGSGLGLVLFAAAHGVVGDVVFRAPLADPILPLAVLALPLLAAAAAGYSVRLLLDDDLLEALRAPE